MCIDLGACESELCALYWIDFLTDILGRLQSNRSVGFFRVKPNQRPIIQSALAGYAGVVTETSDTLPLPDSGTFAVVSSSEALTLSLLSSSIDIFVLPKQPADRLSRCVVGLGPVDEKEIIERDAVNRRLSENEPTIVAVDKKVTLISSIFNGDAFLDAFLENIERLAGYGHVEHFLIRSGSPGNEHKKLVEYVCSHKNAVYINLEKDPGLYDVWNFAIALSTAPYLSNANIDDKRDPGHLQSLVEVLDNFHDVDVASSRLNIEQASEPAEVLFANQPEKIYGFDALTKRTRGQLRSRNLPHCMPVWRRSLHWRFGYFDEQRFAQSADWEFWLRVAVGGVRFYFSSRILGTYARRSDSLWHSSAASKDIDSEIAAIYSPGGVSMRGASLLRAFSHVFTVVNEGRKAEFLYAACQLKRRAVALTECMRVAQFIDIAGSALLNVRNLARRIDEAESRAVELSVDQVVEEIVRKLNCETTSGVEQILVDIAQTRVRRPWQSWASVMIEPKRELGGGFYDFTKLDIQYWRRIQWVNRFERPLQTFFRKMNDDLRSANLMAAADASVSYFPAYRGNQYQNLLYQDFVENGGKLTPIASIEELQKLERSSASLDVVHFHWITDLRGVGSDQDMDRFASARQAIQRLIELGFKILWTVHNFLEHDRRFVEQERRFRHWLSAQAHRVIVHHPANIGQLDWLSPDSSLQVAEHGSYISIVEESLGGHPLRSDRASFRHQYGIGDDERLIVFFGQIRGYKNLDALAEVLKKLARDQPALRFIFAGRIVSEKTIARLLEDTPENLRVIPNRLSEPNLSRLLVAADYGLLSYADILTSGTLFHMLSAGLPVIGPNLGSIPCYLQQGFNGYCYDSLEALAQLLIKISQTSINHREMRRNAFLTASSLEWRFTLPAGLAGNSEV